MYGTVGPNCVLKLAFACSRLVEALEMYDGRGGQDGLGMPNDLLDTYASEDVESQLLSNPLKGHRVCGAKTDSASCLSANPRSLLCINVP